MKTGEESAGQRRSALAVYCGYRLGARSVYRDAALALGAEMGARGIDLVYGGGGQGMMRTVADAVLTAGGRVVGVIPESLAQREEAHPALALDGDAHGSRLEIVPDMHQRKARMLDLADGCVVLPGGLGTLDETFEVLTWAQLGFHSKPCGMINVEGYFDALLRFLDDAVAGGFVSVADQTLLKVAPTPRALLDMLGQ